MVKCIIKTVVTILTKWHYTIIYLKSSSHIILLLSQRHENMIGEYDLLLKMHLRLRWDAYQVSGILQSSDAKQTKRYSGLCDAYIGYNLRTTYTGYIHIT